MRMLVVIFLALFTMAHASTPKSSVNSLVSFKNKIIKVVMNMQSDEGAWDDDGSRHSVLKSGRIITPFILAMMSDVSGFSNVYNEKMSKARKLCMDNSKGNLDIGDIFLLYHIDQESSNPIRRRYLIDEEKQFAHKTFELLLSRNITIKSVTDVFMVRYVILILHNRLTISPDKRKQIGGKLKEVVGQLKDSDVEMSSELYLMACKIFNEDGTKCDRFLHNNSTSTITDQMSYIIKNDVVLMDVDIYKNMDLGFVDILSDEISKTYIDIGVIKERKALVAPVLDLIIIQQVLNIRSKYTQYHLFKRE